MTVDKIYSTCANLDADATITVYPRCIDRHRNENATVYSFNTPIPLYRSGVLAKEVWLFWVTDNNIDVILAEEDESDD